MKNCGVRLSSAMFVEEEPGAPTAKERGLTR